MKPQLSPAASSLLGTSISRRRLLQAAGITGAALAVGTTTSACSSSTPTLNWSNWVEYMDIDEDTGEYPTLKRFQEETGIQVAYTEDINDNNEFFAKVRTQLEQGQSISRDIVVLTDWMAALWIQNGYAQKLDKAAIPNSANLIPRLQNVSFDKPRDYTLPWQGGFAGLGYNIAAYKEATGNDSMTSLDQLFDPALAGRITVLSEMRDTMGCIMAWQGNDPSNFTQEQFEQAIDALSQQVQAGQIRQVTGNDYLAALESGDVIAVIGWSGDVVALGEDFAFELPESGGTLWTDNMLVPAGSERKADAEALMNYYYDPEVAAEVAAYINYLCPVQGAQEAMMAIDPALAEDPFIFPTEEFLNQTYVFMELTPEQNEEYERLFQTAIGN